MGPAEHGNFVENCSSTAVGAAQRVKASSSCRSFSEQLLLASVLVAYFPNVKFLFAFIILKNTVLFDGGETLGEASVKSFVENSH